MKKLFLFSAFICLFLAGAVFAQQKATNFTGTWELDVAKSKLPERMNVESGTLTVMQTDKELSVTTDFKRAPRSDSQPSPTDATGGMRSDGNRRMGQGGGMGRGGNGTVTYNLDGKEMVIKSETPSGMPPTTVSIRAESQKDGKLKLTSSRSFDTPNGSMSIKTIDIWELAEGGKTLKVTRETETPRGSQTAEMYFTRKAVTSALTVTAPISPAQTAIVSDGEPQITNGNPANATNQTPKVVKSGVLNGKVLKLVQPEYPPAARAVRASGAVNVQVTFDEQGNVVSASAVSGHPLLRAASEKAARQCKFAPVILDGVPVKVTGVIIYNFVP